MCIDAPQGLIQIGPVLLRGRAFLAPMSGLTDVVMRRIARRFGAGLVVTEMVAAGAFARGDAESQLRAEGAGLDPHVVQITGCEPDAMAEAARMAQAQGASIIDINMGCPAKKVTGGYAGSHLMRDLPLAVGLIGATVRAVTIPVTVKMRLGWDDANRNAAELARRAELEGAAMITVHGRTRQQFYAGAADWTAIRTVKRAVAIPVVANGDCASLYDARTMLDRSGADAVMIGRAAVGQPWIVGEIGRGLSGSVCRRPPAKDRLAAAIEHYEGMLGLLGREQGLRHARKHLAAYAEQAVGPAASALRARLVTTSDPETAKAMLKDLFASEEAA